MAARISSRIAAAVPTVLFKTLRSMAAKSWINMTCLLPATSTIGVRRETAFVRSGKASGATTTVPTPLSRSLCKTTTYGLRRADAASGFRKMSNCLIKSGAGVRSTGRVLVSLCSTPQSRLCSRPASAALLPREWWPANFLPERMRCSNPALWPATEGRHRRKGWWHVFVREQVASDVHQSCAYIMRITLNSPLRNHTRAPANLTLPAAVT